MLQSYVDRPYIILLLNILIFISDTVTANPDIQLATINLLRNLIKLRVNYSLLDHDGVFLRVLRSQIECSEKLIWRISDCEQILPSIFSFLVSISDDTKGIWIFEPQGTPNGSMDAERKHGRWFGAVGIHEKALSNVMK